MEIKSENYALMEDNGDGTTSVHYHLMLGGNLMDLTLVIDQPLETFFLEMMPTISEDSVDKMEQHAVRVPNSAELA